MKTCGICECLQFWPVPGSSTWLGYMETTCTVEFFLIVCTFVQRSTKKSYEIGVDSIEWLIDWNGGSLVSCFFSYSNEPLETEEVHKRTRLSNSSKRSYLKLPRLLPGLLSYNSICISSLVVTKQICNLIAGRINIAA